MKIAGMQKVTLIDYPGKIACTLFLFGCNFKCGFCHNPELILGRIRKEFSKEEVFEFLEKRKGELEGVCITGGEPLMNLEKDFLKKIKEKGYLIKIDTNGSFPEKLKEFIDEHLVDFIAMDLKGSFENYEKIVDAKINVEKIKKSILLIENSRLDYEFRTTIVPDIHNENEIKFLGEEVVELLGKKPKKYCLQGFVNNGKFVDGSYIEKKDVGASFLRDLKKIALGYFEEVEVRC